MSKIHVTVELNFDKLDDTASRELAKQMLEAHGLNVVRTTTAKSEKPKAFTPKAGKPGSVLRRAGRVYEVWSEGPNRGALWVVPVERKPDDATVYLTSEGSDHVTPYHGDGTSCGPSVEVTYQPAFKRVETPCQHESHKRVA